MKKLNVLPSFFAPNVTGHVWPGTPQFFRSSALLIGVCSDSMVRKAARLAVYDDTMINVKNHQMAATILVDAPLKYKCEIDQSKWHNLGVCM